MKKSAKISFIVSSILFALFVLFTVLVKFVGVAGVGPNDSLVGFSDINQSIFNFFGCSDIWGKITNILGILAIVVVLATIVLVGYQFIKRKSIFKIDKELMFMGIIYLCLIFIYAFFEIVVINFRPILVDGNLEASYPSSHTLLVSTVMISSIFLFNSQIRNKNARLIYCIFAVVLAIVTVLGRIFAGVHWFTDVFAGVLLSSALIVLYYALLVRFCSNKKDVVELEKSFESEEKLNNDNNEDISREENQENLEVAEIGQIEVTGVQSEGEEK